MEIKVSTESGRVPVTVLHVDGNILLSSYKRIIQKSGTFMYSEFITAAHGQGAARRAV